jgi:dihydropteroate synthase
MGIINITPDSFYKGNREMQINKVLTICERHIKEGADFIDIGGYSSRPGAENININTELQRVIPIIQAINKEFPNTIISIDTFRSKVAKEGIINGVSIINDISALNIDKELFTIVKKYNIPYILMHIKGNPKNMQENTNYKNLLREMIYFLSEKLNMLKLNGINDIIIDPGFGFSKTLKQNFTILNDLEKFKILDSAILVGISRKSMIYNTLNIKPLDALNGTSALNMIALQNGANILRVHDVKQAKECITLHNEINK